MNKIIKSLLVAALMVSANAGAHTNKTFLKPRNNALVNLPLEQTTWLERTNAPLENRFGGNFQVIGFYGQNTNKKETGKYFGTLDRNEFSLKGENILRGITRVDVDDEIDEDDEDEVSSPSSSPSNGPGSRISGVERGIDGGYIIHRSDNNSALNLNMKLAPKSTSYGVNLVYHQDLSKILNGLYLKVNLPIQHVENDPDLSIEGAGAGHLTADNFVSYFKGSYAPSSALGNANAQSYLRKGKIDGKQSATGVADIDVMLGYNFLKKETYHIGLNIGLSIPTGKEATGEYMFEPIYGSKNFGLGAGLTAGARIWGDDYHNFKLNFAANYRYLFEASEKRYTGIKGRNFGQYYLLAKQGVAANVQKLQPAANILTQNVNVTPGSQFDGIIGLAYNRGGFGIDLGYNAYFRERESVKLKNDFSEGTWYIASRSHDGSSNGIVGEGVHFDNNNAGAGNNVAGAHSMLKCSDLDIEAAETGSQFTNSIYGGVGYTFKEWEYPLMLGLGGKYEFASKNSALEGWQAWLKAGLSF